MKTLSRLEADQPLVLILSEPRLQLSRLIEDFLQTSSLETRTIFLDESFFDQARDFLKQNRQIYKIVLLCGFGRILPDFYLEVFSLVDKINEKQSQVVPTILLSEVCSFIETVEELDREYNDFLSKQTNFLAGFLKKFPQSQVFLAQDLLLTQEKITYPLLFFFSALQQNGLIDPQKKFYFQDEASFFGTIKLRLIKPHIPDRFLLRGRAVLSTALLKKTAGLYEQYFQKKLKTFQIFSEVKKADFLNEFTLVKNSGSKIEALVDQKIRLIPHLQRSAQGSKASLEAIRAATVESVKENQKKLQKEAQKDFKKPFSYNLFSLFKNPRKKPLSEPQEEFGGEELTGKIEELFSSHRNLEKQVRQEKNIEQGEKIIKKTKKRRWLFGIGLTVSILGFTVLFLALLFSYSQKLLQKQLFLAVKNNGESIEKIDESILYSVFYFQHQQYRKYLLEESLTGAADLVQLKTALSNLVPASRNYRLNSYQLYKKTLEGGFDLSAAWEDALSSLDNKIAAQRELGAYLADLNLDLYEGEEQQFWNFKLEENKAELKDSLQAKRFLEAFSVALLEQGRTNVLILVQDSNELRASGGFLTEAIILSFEKGFLIDKQVYSIDELGDRVYGSRAAPEEIKRVLSEEVFYLHDANWEGDFALASLDIAWFFEQSLGQRIGFFVALNSKTMSELLASWGGVDVQEELKINQGNYLEILRNKALSDHEIRGELRTSWQLARKVLEKIVSLSEGQFFDTMNVLRNSLNQRELLFYSTNQALAQSIEINSWGGQKIEAACPVEFKQESCLTDSFFQLEANVSTNKVSAMISREISHDIGITADFIRHRRKIVFENSSTSNLWPLGEYRGFLRFYFHPDADLEKVELNGQRLGEENMVLNRRDDRSQLSLTINVPNQQSADLLIVYTVPNSAQADFSYVFFDQKQAGILDKKTVYRIVFDEDLHPQLVAPSGTYQNKTLIFNNDNLDHFLFAIDFSRDIKDK